MGASIRRPPVNNNFIKHHMLPLIFQDTDGKIYWFNTVRWNETDGWIYLLCLWALLRYICCESEKNIRAFSDVLVFWWLCNNRLCISLRATSYDDVINWKHFRVTGPLCGEFTGHRWIPRTNGWVNNREAGDVRRHSTHYDVNVMSVREPIKRLLQYQWCIPVEYGYLLHQVGLMISQKQI